MKSSCISRPTCRCDFCVRARTEPSARDEENEAALGYISSLTEWFKQGQCKDFTLTEQEWQHAVREYRKVQ